MAVLEIRATGQFRHAGHLSGYRASDDPRSPDFDWDAVRIDLSQCYGFIRPAATLWSLVYPLLVASKGIPCEVSVPSDERTTNYLNDLGLFEALRRGGVKVNHDRPVNKERHQLVLPITRLGSITQVEQVEEEILEQLGQSNLSSINVYFHVSQAFGELGNNAIEHSDSSIDAYGLVQFYRWKGGPTFICAVADGGIGIKASLQMNPEYRSQALTDKEAIHYAIQENISGTGVSTRGIGLYHVASEIVQSNLGRQFFINSWVGFLYIYGNQERPRAIISSLFPGTLASINVPG